MEITPEEREKQQKIEQLKVKGCLWLLQIAVILIPVYLFIEYPARRLFRSEEMSNFYWCINNNKQMLNTYYKERDKIRKKLGQELDYPYISNCGKLPSRKWKWQPKDY